MLNFYLSIHNLIIKILLYIGLYIYIYMFPLHIVSNMGSGASKQNPPTSVKTVPENLTSGANTLNPSQQQHVALGSNLRSTQQATH